MRSVSFLGVVVSCFCLGLGCGSSGGEDDPNAASGGGSGGSNGGNGGTGGSSGSVGAGAGSGGAQPIPCDNGSCECDDGIDNDGDGLVDWRYDLGCVATNDNTEGGVPSGEIDQGWTVFEPSPDTQIVYVSADGNDTWSGTLPEPNGDSSDGPKQSIEAGLGLLRDGYPDWLLLRRGDHWVARIPVPVSGRSPSERVVISSYGESLERPVVSVNADNTWGGDVTTSGHSNLAVLHLHFKGKIDGPLIGVSGSADALVEGCLTEGSGLYAGGDTSDHLRIRRNASIGGGGYFLSHVHDLLIEDNVIHRPNAHGMYITRGGNEDVVTRGNLVLKVPAGTPNEGNLNAIMQRPGGLAEGNVVGGAGWSGIVMGSCNDGDGTPCAPPVPATILGNLILDSWGINDSQADQVLPDAEIRDNIMIRSGIKWDGAGVNVENNTLIDAALDLGKSPGPNISWRKNHVFRTDDGVLVAADALGAATGFVVEENRFFSTGSSPDKWFQIPGAVDFSGWKQATGDTGSDAPIDFVDPSRTTLEAYNQSLGAEANLDAFFAEAAKQAKFALKTEYTAAAVIQWFREGLTEE